MKCVTVVTAEIVKTMIPDAKRPGKRRPYIVGTKITMADGSWWMYSRKHGTWTKHEAGLPQFHKSGSPLLGDDMKPVVGKERKESYGTSARLQCTMGHCPRLLSALADGLIVAA